MSEKEKKTVDLDNPVDARWYVANFDWGNRKEKPSYIELSNGARINFDNMTDEEAVTAARGLYFDIRIQIEKRNSIVQ